MGFAPPLSMAKKTYKHARLTGESSKSIEGAINAALETSAKAVQGHSWFQVADIRGSLGSKGQVEEYQVTMDVAFEVIESKMK